MSPIAFDFDLPARVEELRQAVREFALRRIAPLADEIDRSNRFPRELWPEMGAMGLLGMTVPEVMNRATVTGAIEIGRAPGVVQITFRAPVDRVEARGLLSYAREQYPG